MNDDLTRGTSSGSPNPKRGLAFFAIGVVFVALGVGLLFVDGLDIVSWTLIPGGAIWIILGLSSRSARPSARTAHPKPASRKDDGAAPIVFGDAGSTRSGSRADDHPAHDAFDGGGFGGGDGGGGGGD